MTLYQIGIDLMITDNGDIYLIENNSNCFLTLPTAHHDLNKNKNREYAIKRYIDSLHPFFEKHNITTLFYRTLMSQYVDLYEAWVKKGYKITKKYEEVKIIFRRDPLTDPIDDKQKLEEDYHLYEKIGIKKIPSFNEYSPTSPFPNFLLKPVRGMAGSGIEFYNQKEIIDKKGYVRQGYIKPKEQNYLLEWDGKKLYKFELGENRLFDIRSIIYISDKGDLIFAGTYKRVSGLSLPTEIPYGKLPTALTKPFLCNTSQDAYRSFMTLEEEMEYKEISLNIGKIMYDNYIKNGSNER